MTPIEFLLKVWAVQCQPGDFVATASKEGSNWSDHTFAYDDQLEEKLTRWIDRGEGKDMYFCPLPFTIKKRSKAHVRASRFLWSDIDDADPHLIEPTVLWESSPGRYQGLWMLPRAVSPEDAASKSRDLAYYIGADRGGWDLTQVLRIPGTRNHKYPNAPAVKMVHWNKDVLRQVPKRAIDKWRNTIPRKLIRTIEGPAEVGKRSDMLWFLEHELCDLGIPLDDVIEILRASEWNKYRGRDDEDERFAAEREKLAADRGVKGTPTRVESVVFSVETYSGLMGKQATNPGWMVRDWWMRGSHGIVAGEPKSFKSTLVLDLLFSVASDKPFLGRYPVEYGGPVIIVQNENADWIMKDRLEKLAFSRGECGSVSTRAGRLRIQWARELPLLFVNQQGFTLDDAANCEALEEMIRTVRPVALTLDPLYLMFSGDVNSAKDLNPVLSWCLRMKQEYGCSIILVHHYGKGSNEKRGGQRMLGSTTLHGFIESAWYIQAQEAIEGKALITLDREFRGAGIYEKVDAVLDLGEAGNTKYDVQVIPHGTMAGAATLDDDIYDAIASSVDYLNISQIAKATGYTRRQVEAGIASLITEDRIERQGERYGIRR